MVRCTPLLSDGKLTSAVYADVSALRLDAAIAFSTNNRPKSEAVYVLAHFPENDEETDTDIYWNGGGGSAGAGTDVHRSTAKDGGHYNNTNGSRHDGGGRGGRVRGVRGAGNAKHVAVFVFVFFYKKNHRDKTGYFVTPLPPLSPPRR